MHLPVELYTTTFWLSFLNIVWADILLSGDNAVVIALACQHLPPKKRTAGMILGTGGAVLVRIFFTGAVGFVMTLPYLKLLGGAALIFVATKMLVPDDDDAEVHAHDKLYMAIFTVVLADIMMSMDNVIAIAAIAKGDDVLMALGLAISIPLVVSGAAVISRVLEKLPVLVWAGAGFLGWVAGGIMATDTALPSYAKYMESVYSSSGALIVLGLGLAWRSYHKYKELT